MNENGSDTRHVLPNNERGGWDVLRGGAKRASGYYDIKNDAIDSSREISRNQGTEFRIHNKDLKIASSDSHGNDPRNIKG